MKDWAQEIFGAFIGVLATISVIIFQGFRNRKREKVEMHKLYLELIEEIEEHKNRKIAELDQYAKELEDSNKANSLRYKDTIDQLLIEMQQQGKIIMEQEKSIMELTEELREFKKEVINNGQNDK